jgi:D-glycero-D-manno-heptose 1,7-bisphosphate phosphatase
MEFLPGACEAIRCLNNAGFLVIVVSNQRCVAKGLITTEELESMHARMCSEFHAAGAIIDAVYYCPHDNQPSCGCRKPQPGMLLDAARVHDVLLGASWMIGDSEKDMQAGRNAGCSTAQVVADEQSASGCADLVAASLLDAIRKILQIH